MRARSNGKFIRHRLAICVLLLCAAWPLASCQMKELTSLPADHSQFPEPMACGKCHVAIYQEWESSPHAKAYVSQSFQRATNDYRFRECLACHAPEPTFTTTRPVARTADCNLGVVCVSCHLDQGAMVGPRQPTGVVKPHPIVVDAARFLNGQECGRCHESTLQQWQAFPATAKQDCAACHMPEVTRTMTQATDLISKPIVAMEKPNVEHRHVFDCPDAHASADDYALNAVATNHRITVTLQNRLPHNLPTGDFGVRLVQVTATAVNATGKQSEIAQWEIAGTQNQSLAPGAVRRWDADLPAGTQTVRLSLARKDRNPADTVVILEKAVAIP